MNPFDAAMVDPDGFYSLGDRALVEKFHLDNIKSKNRIYYNPSWSLLGDFISSKSYLHSKRIGGTFRFEEKKSRKLHWYLVDQIIINNELLNDFNSETLRIIDPKEYVDLLFEKKIKKVPKLDHLPIVFSFNV